MNLVINALQYKSESSGIGILLRELFGRCAAAGETARVVLPADSPPFPGAARAKTITAPCAYGEGLKRIAFQSCVMGPRYCKDAVLLTTDSKVPLLLPKSCRVVSLVTDLALFRMPEVYQASRVLLWKRQYRYLRRRGDLFLAISEFTKREMAELLDIPESRIHVVPCAAPTGYCRVTDTRRLAALREKYHLQERFVLFVGNFNPRKNLERLIAAFDRMKRESGLPHELVIAGGQGWKFDRDAALAGIASKAAVRFIGYIPDADMPALYSAAELFAFPTLYEGFGIPVVEAQKCGTPVLASNVSALPEVGGAGAVYVDPRDEKAIADSLRKLLTEGALRRELRERGYANAGRFSWEGSAQKLREIIEGRYGT